MQSMLGNKISNAVLLATIMWFQHKCIKKLLNKLYWCTNVASAHLNSLKPFCGGPVANLKQDLVFMSKPVAQTAGHDPGSISLFTSRYCSGSMDCCGVTEFTVTNITWIFKCRALARQQQAQWSTGEKKENTIMVDTKKPKHNTHSHCLLQW